MGIGLIERARKGRITANGFDTRIRAANTVNKELKKAEENLKIFRDLYLVDLFERTKEAISQTSPDVQFKHSVTWSEMNLSWNFQEHDGNQGRYTVGKGIFAYISEGEVYIDYSGTENKPKLATKINVGDLVEEARKKARLPDFF